MSEPPKRKRRWYQFSLRSLLIFTLIVAIPCAWLGRKIEKKRRERDAAEEIKKRGGVIMYDYQKPDPVSGRQGQEPNGPIWLRSVLGQNFFSEVYAVFLDHSVNADNELRLLKEFPSLRMLYVNSCRFTDAGLANIETLTDVRILGLGGPDSGIRDAGLEHLKCLTELKTLALSDTDISDAGLVYVGRLPRLQSLFLNRTKISDVGLLGLKGLNNLVTIELKQTKVTDAGVKGLQKALPKCLISFGSAMSPVTLTPASRR